MKICKLTLIFFCLRSSRLPSYLSNVSPVKTSNYLKRKYFNFTLTDDADIRCGVCFSLEKHKLFSRIEEKQSSNSGIELIKFKVAENDNIIINDFTSAKKIDLHFNKKKLSKSFPLIQ